MNILAAQTLLTKLLENNSTSQFLAKELEETDYHKGNSFKINLIQGYFELLSQLTISPLISFPAFQGFNKIFT